MNIQIFKNNQFGEIRTIVEDNKILFSGFDVATSLGYANPNEAVVTHCKSSNIEKRYVAHKNGVGGVNAYFIPESEVYRLTMRSNLKSAEKFQDWVTEDVLPSIRKHGAYMTDVTIEKVLTDPDLLISLATALKEGKEREEKLKNIASQQYKEIELQEAKIKEQRPDVKFSKSVKKNGSDCLVGELAKIICQSGTTVGQNRLFEWLRDSGYLIKGGRQKNAPKQQYVESGLFRIAKGEVETKRGNVIITSTTMVTPKGQHYFVNKYIEDTDF